MSTLSIMTLHGQEAPISPEVLLELTSKVGGKIMQKGDPGYDDARRIWNGMVDRSPALIVRCAGSADVVQAIAFARQHQLLLAVRSGGHNIAGNAVCEGGLMIDLSGMMGVRVDPVAKKAWVEPGATLADLDRETQAFGLAVPTGINSTTGIAGLTLGGGFGWITRKFGLTIDSLVSADVITAEGKLVRASAEENEDLFWAIRGGGGNFGIVTGFEFNLHPVGPEVLSGLVVHPFEDAAKLLKQYRAAVDNAPEELTCWAVMRRAPPLPFLPTDWHGREVLILAMCYLGDPAEGARVTQELRSLGKPIADVVGPHRFVDWQGAFDPLLSPGARNYWKSHDLDGLPDGAIEAIVDAVHTLPSDEAEVFIAHVGGAMSHVAPDATAFPQRRSHFVMNVHARWRDRKDDSHCTAWARHLFGATEPFATGSAYVNFMPDDETERVEKIYGLNYRRLAEIKGQYDPDNVFRLNQNIRPVPHHTGHLA
ncbi:FAD-binding oxidoreductase [Microvirga massiliensis]|uniref:FAD-binding oxidoreductase n=1 Tax=Microvirga massiliensis TaxID=1033741 RepID=UPI00062BE15F